MIGNGHKNPSIIGPPRQTLRELTPASAFFIHPPQPQNTEMSGDLP
jgi:hypothetical protein